MERACGDSPRARPGPSLAGMDFPDKLRAWGATHTQARALERAAARQPGAGGKDLAQEARTLREQADRLHREIYSEIGRRDKPGG